MTGEKQFSSVTDMLLDDVMYLKLHHFIERCNKVLGKNKSIFEHTFNHDEGWGISFEITNKDMYLGGYRDDSVAMSLIIGDGYTHQNSVTSKSIIAHAGTKHTDFSPFKKIVHDKMYNDIGWFITNNVITEEIESELFQESTVSDVYSLFEMQEIMNRLQNLPLMEKSSLTINDKFILPRYYQSLDEHLKGY